MQKIEHRSGLTELERRASPSVAHLAHENVEGTGYGNGSLRQSEASELLLTSLAATLEKALQDQDGVNGRLGGQPISSSVDLIDECPEEWNRADAVLTSTLGQITRISAQSLSATRRKLYCYHRAVAVLSSEDSRLWPLATSILADLSVVLSNEEGVENVIGRRNGAPTADATARKSILPRLPTLPDVSLPWRGSRRSQTPG